MSEARDDTEAYEPNDDLDAGLAAAFGPAASVFASLCESSPGLRPVELRHAPEEGSGLVERPNSREMPDPSTTGRYQVFGEIARGGMGAILRGRDPDLGRDIAIKVLRDDHRASPKMIERFVEEAQIGGQLQHPGIAPVYELNQFSDRRPYFTMKLVKGRTLAALFADRADLADNRAHLVSIFTHIAQTMAYAHSRGVIHRDLKPANIMVGNFGEVQVMDWGLAKVLSTGGLADEQRSQKDNKSRTPWVNAVSEIKTFRSTGSGSETMAGSLLGTPAYMSPEQARGDTELVDERSDVFGLGAILCELLTGKPAFTGESAAEVQRKAGLGELSDAMARLDSADADEELVDLARRCLAAEPWNRPRDAKSVADSAAGYQAASEDRLRRAEKDCAVAEMRAEEERKRRRIGMALVASVLLTLGMAGAGIWWWHDRQQKAARDAEMAQAGAILAVERGLTEAAQFRDAGRWSEGQIAARKAEEFLPTNATSEMRKRVADMQADLKLLVALDENRVQYSGERQDVFDAEGANSGYEAAFREYGVDINAIDPATAQDRFPAPIRVHVAEAIDHWGWLRALYMEDRPGWKRLLELAQTVDAPNPWRQRLRTARLQKESTGQLVELARSPDRLSQSPATLVVLARNLRDANQQPQLAIELLDEARLRFPGDFWINFELGQTCMKVRRHSDAVRCFNAALSTRPQNTFVMTTVAWALLESGNSKEAEAICRRVIQQSPRFDWGHGLLGFILLKNDKFEEAVVECRAAADLDSKDPNWPNNMGFCQVKLKQHSEAEANYRKALTIAPDYGFAIHNLVELLNEQGRKAEVTTLYRDAVTHHPDVLSSRLRLVEHTGDARDLDEAIGCFRRTLAKAPANFELTHRLAKALDKQNRGSEKTAIWKEALASSPGTWTMLVELAYISRSPADIDTAVASLQESLKDAPKVTPWNRNAMGSMLRIRRKYALAEEVLRDGIRLNVADRNTYRDLNNVLMEAGRRADAIVLLRDAVKRFPDDAELWNLLGLHLYTLGRPQEAIEPLKRSVQLDANQQLAWNMLGFSQFRLGNFVAAREAMVQAHEAVKRKSPDNDSTYSDYRGRSNDMARFAKLADDLPAIVDGVILPKNAAEALDFAKVCQFRGFPTHAFRFYQTAFTADPKRAVSFDVHQAAFGAIQLSVSAKSSLKAAAARQQALEWLRADLPRVDRLISANQSRTINDARLWLNRWQEEDSYAPVRDPAQLAKLPADERTAWNQYWADLKSRSEKLGQPEPASVE